MDDERLLELIKSIDSKAVRVPNGVRQIVNAVMAIEREECAMILDKGAAVYRAMKGNDEPVGVTTGDEECEELAYCCELNARYIRERSNVKLSGAASSRPTRTAG